MKRIEKSKDPRILLVYKNGQKVKVTGAVTEIGGEQWLVVDSKAESKTDKPVAK